MTRKAKVIIVVLAVGLGVPLLLLMGVVGIIAYYVLGGLGIGTSESYGNPDEFIFRTDPTPHWSPDGSTIVFGHSDGRIYVVEADGTRLRSIAGGSGKYDVDISPSVSPDGTRIAYATLRYKTGGTREFEIVTSGLDGSDRRRLTENQVRDRHPVWSSRGKIAFMSSSWISSPASTAVVTMFSDGSGARQVVSLGGSSPGAILSPPVWSPDSSRIAFVAIDRDQDSSNYAVYVGGIDGSDLTLIRETSRKPYKPSWSPDGSRIAFAERDDQSNMTEVYTAGHDGSNLRTLLYLPGKLSEPSFPEPSFTFFVPDDILWAPMSWSPDGSEILVDSSIISLEGSSRLTLPGPGGAASWSLDGSRVAINVQGSAGVAIPGHVGADYDDITFSPRAEAEVVLYTVSRDGSDTRVLVVQDDDGTLLPGNGRPLDDGQPSTTIYFDASGRPLPKPFDIEQCSNGVVVPDPGANYLLVDDCETLLRIRDSLGGTSLPLNWSTNLPISEWEGIDSFDVFGVREIRLYGRYLTGVISPEFGNLSALVELNLQGNLLHGEIPAELGNLASLHGLYLSGNELEGEIPGELGNLTNVRWFDLSGNELEGEIPGELGNLASLHSLYLSGNELEGEIPGELGNLTNVQELDLSENKLEGKIPGELGNLLYLKELALSDNMLASVPEELANLNLRMIWLEGNPIEGCIPKGILEKMFREDYFSDNPFEPCEN